MKAFYLFILLFSSATFSSAQENYTVTYRTESYTVTGFDAERQFVYGWYRNPDVLYRLTVDHHKSFFRKLNARPPAFLHKPADCDCYSSAYYRDEKGFGYYPVPPITEKKLMVKDSSMEGKWYFSTETDTILGLPCRKATALIGSNYINAWYAWDLPHGYGPFSYNSLPGTILKLETAFAKYIATDITEEKEEVRIPETSIIDAASYTVISREKRMYRAGLLGRRVDPYEVPRVPPSMSKYF